VEYDWGIGNLSNLTVAVTIELLGHIDAEGATRVQSRLVEKFDSNNDVLILPLRVLLGDGMQNLDGLFDGIASLPSSGIRSKSLARVVESILRAWCAVEVNDYLES
jgi:hypothetical protein